MRQKLLIVVFGDFGSEEIVPTLRVGMQPGTLCVPKPNAERP
jgi:hypothetical protein